MIKEDFYSMFSYDKECVYDGELYSFVEDILLPNRKILPKLYRYSPSNYYNIRGLETQNLFLSTIGTMNDIFEGLACEIDDKVLNNIDRYSDIAYLKSFSEEKDNLLMWAHYADNYCGMCVEYDFSKLSEAALYHLFPVYYSNKRFTKQDLNYTISNLYWLKIAQEEGNSPDETFWLKDIMYLFLVKPKCWEYEKEWRLVGTFPQVTDDAENIGDEELAKFYNISQKISVKDCVTAVYLGARMKKDIKEHISEICNEKLPNVKVFSAKLSKDRYALEFIQYDENKKM